MFGAHKNDPRILEGKQVFLDYKSKVQRGDVIQIFEINGNPAMGWEVGKKNTVLMFDNGIKRIIGESSYPASVVMIDQKERVSYSLNAYISLEELKKMMVSIYQ